MRVMRVMREDQTNLITLVALLISTVGFKEQLTSVRLGSTDFTMFNVFLIATIAFGFLLYVHLLVNSYLLFLNAFREKKKHLYLIILRLSSVLILVIIPLSSIFIASYNWITTEVCVTGSYTDDLFTLSKTSAETVCQSPLVSTILPMVIGLFVAGSIYFIVRKRERTFRNLLPEQKEILTQINEYRMFQAVSSDLNTINEVQLKIDDLVKRYDNILKNTSIKKH